MLGCRRVANSPGLLNSPGVYAGIVLVLVITGMHEMLLRRLEHRVAAYRQS